MIKTVAGRDGAVVVAPRTGLVAAVHDNPLRAACERTGRGLDRAEWERFIAGLEYQDTCA